MDEFSKPFVGAVASSDPGTGIEGEADAVSESELREFLAADALGAPADPAFKHKLQGRLWDIVQTRLQKQRRRKWFSGWHRRELPPADATDAAAKPKREQGPV